MNFSILSTLAFISISSSFVGARIVTLCPRNLHLTGSTAFHDAENVFHALKKLPNDCFTYEDEKYTYEYCHMESVRQTGLTLQNNLREEYHLGRYIHNLSIQKYSPLLHLAKITLVGGDPCVVEGKEGDQGPRKTKVKFYCADPKLSMHIVKAYEKKICNYRILVHVPELCFEE